MKRFLLLLLLIEASHASSWADTALVVHRKSGETIEFAFSEEPVVTYADGFLVVSEGKASVLYPLTDIQKFTFGEVTDHVTRITSPADALPHPTYIYNVGGMLLRTFSPSDDRSTSASLDGLPAGTYIIKNGTTSYKIIKK